MGTHGEVYAGPLNIRIFLACVAKKPQANPAPVAPVMWTLTRTVSTWRVPGNFGGIGLYLSSIAKWMNQTSYHHAILHLQNGHIPCIVRYSRQSSQDLGSCRRRPSSNNTMLHWLARLCSSSSSRERNIPSFASSLSCCTQGTQPDLRWVEPCLCHRGQHHQTIWQDCHRSFRMPYTIWCSTCCCCRMGWDGMEWNGRRWDGMPGWHCFYSQLQTLSPFATTEKTEQTTSSIDWSWWRRNDRSASPTELTAEIQEKEEIKPEVEVERWMNRSKWIEVEKEERSEDEWQVALDSRLDSLETRRWCWMRSWSWKKIKEGRSGKEQEQGRRRVHHTKKRDHTPNYLRRVPWATDQHQQPATLRDRGL